MKKVYLAMIAMLVGTFASAQSFTFSDHVMEINTSAGVSHYASTTISNTSGGSAHFEYTLISNSLDLGWDLQFCDPLSCFLNAHVSDTFSLRSNGTAIFKLDIYPNNVSAIGSISYKVWNTANTSDADTITWNVNTTMVGTADPSLDKNISVSPNPATDRLHLQAINGNLGKGQASIFDLNGKMLSSTDIKGVASIDLDVSTLAPGMYLLRYNTNGTVINRKFMKAE